MLTQGDEGRTTEAIPVPKDPSKTHPYREEEVINRTNAALESKTTINQYDVRCVVKLYDIKSKTNFYYQGKVPNSPGQYSPEFVEWIVKQYEKDTQFFSNARREARRHRNLGTSEA